jgi:acyl-CoA thioesterase-1
MLLASGPALADEVVIATLGDSLTQGYGLVSEQGFVPQMQGWLDAQGLDVRLINAGVSGDTTAGGLARIHWTLTEDVDALIVALGGNDVLRGIDPGVSRANLDGILSVAQDRKLPVLLVGISVPGNYGPEYQTSFRAIFPELAEIHGATLYPDFLTAITEEDTGTALATLLQGDGIHPNAEGVRRIVEDMGPSVKALVGAAKP